MADLDERPPARINAYQCQLVSSRSSRAGERPLEYVSRDQRGGTATAPFNLNATLQNELDTWTLGPAFPLQAPIVHPAHQKFAELLYHICGEDGGKWLEVRINNDPGWAASMGRLSDEDRLRLAAGEAKTSRRKAKPLEPDDLEALEVRAAVAGFLGLPADFVPSQLIATSIVAPPSHQLPPRQTEHGEEANPIKKKFEVVPKQTTPGATAKKHHDVLYGSGSGSTGGGAQNESVAGELNGKGGLFRHNLLGKRTTDSGRSVVGPSTAMDVGDIGVPMGMAEKLLTEEWVTEWNICELSRLVSTGHVRYIKRAGVCRSVASEPELRVGDIAVRRVRDGDWVMANRFPSLHMLSFMAHRIRIVHEANLVLNPLVTPPYNADFDGDEMNIYALRGIAEAVEASLLMCSENNMLSVHDNVLVMSFIQDSIVALYDISIGPKKLTEMEFKRLLAVDSRHTHRVDIGSGKEFYTIFDLLERVLPPVNFVFKGEQVLREGRFQRFGGTPLPLITKQFMGSAGSHGGLVYRIATDFGSRAAANFIDVVQRMMIEWLTISPVSFGVRDCTNDAAEAIRASEIERMLSKAAAEGRCDLNEACAESFAERMEPTLGEDNRMMKMVRSGAKGTPGNATNITHAVGYQMIGGQGVFDGLRLPADAANAHPTPHDRFIKRPYICGLTAKENFVAMAGGRNGAVAVKMETPKAGELNKELAAVMESCTIVADRTVRGFASGRRIISFTFGGDTLWPGGLYDHNVNGGKIELPFDPDFSFSSTPFLWDATGPCQQNHATKLRLKEIVREEEAHVCTGWGWYPLRDRLEEHLVGRARGFSLEHEAALRHDLKTIGVRLNNKRAPCGIYAGVIAAQAITEQVTQSSLDTFHVAGKDSVVKSGLDAMKALLWPPKTAKGALAASGVFQHAAEELRGRKDWRAFGEEHVISGTFEKVVCENIAFFYERGIPMEKMRFSTVSTAAKYLGIDAAKRVFIEEMCILIQSSGMRVNYRHVLLLADVMCRDGSLRPLGKHGMDDMGTMSRAKEHNVMDTFTNAAHWAKVEDSMLPSECAVIGKLIQGGTGYSKLSYDFAKLPVRAPPRAPPRPTDLQDGGADDMDIDEPAHAFLEGLW